jgi:predicted transcriptional regulator
VGTKDTTYTFRIETELLERLKAIQQGDDIPVSAHIRRAIRAYLVEKGELEAGQKSGRKRADTRRRP